MERTGDIRVLRKIYNEWIQMFRESKKGVIGFYWFISVVTFAVGIIQYALGHNWIVTMTVAWIFFGIWSELKFPFWKWDTLKKLY